ncbi:lysophospholipid acyltransferase family protein [Marinobacter changyiensis]|uniref:lysophospholipid acyltransferase family protein n=1 Tax=Marinobacter changyiensis TaxID=2604091 RepID=UPI00126453D0|nr:lysophospholipid acyltransferase family protein [Marinobacter changyiensis]
MNTLNRLWRILATGFSFVVFGLGGLLLPLVIAPASAILRNDRRRERWVKQLIGRCFWTFVRLMESLGILTYDIRGLDRLREPGRLIIANHPTLIDVVFLMALVPNADCVIKSALMRNPFTRGPLKAGQYIANDDPAAVVEAARGSMERGNSLIIFPEGTRSTPGREMTLQRGAANIAIRAGQNLTPVIITCSPPTLTKQTPWYQVPDRRFHMTFSVGDDIEVEPFLQQRPALMSRRLTDTIKDYFTTELARYERP